MASLSSLSVLSLSLSVSPCNVTIISVSPFIITIISCHFYYHYHLCQSFYYHYHLLSFLLSLSSLSVLLLSLSSLVISIITIISVSPIITIISVSHDSVMCHSSFSVHCFLDMIFPLQVRFHYSCSVNSSITVNLIYDITV